MVSDLRRAVRRRSVAGPPRSSGSHETISTVWKSEREPRRLCSRPPALKIRARREPQAEGALQDREQFLREGVGGQPGPFPERLEHPGRPRRRGASAQPACALPAPAPVPSCTPNWALTLSLSNITMVKMPSTVPKGMNMQATPAMTRQKR